MEEFYRVDPVLTCSNDEDDDVVVEFENMTSSATAATTSTSCAIFHNHSYEHHLLPFDQSEEALGADQMSDLIKAQIANHPRYPDVVAAYIECQKVGAPPETASLLEEISRENHLLSCCSEIGADPELDEFMESYCEILHRYKEELSKPFNEATTFLCSIESQLSNLCRGTLTRTLDYRSAGGNCEEEWSNGGAESEEISGGGVGRAVDPEVKEMLLHKYSGYLSSLRKEFLKKRKKGKLPKHARTALLDWWNSHYTWPYPTEEEKAKLSEMTGLDQKQINNWFINQRKRHWKPTEEMRFALMEGQ